jgi:hypothetical protein
MNRLNVTCAELLWLAQMTWSWLKNLRSVRAVSVCLIIGSVATLVTLMRLYQAEARPVARFPPTEIISNRSFTRTRQKALDRGQYEELDIQYRIPNNVFYVWCGRNRYFEFRHYLSIVSVFRYLKPYRVVFFYEREPMIDEQGYHTWLAELVQQYPLFHRERLPADWCSDLPASVNDYLQNHGGMYLREDVVFVRPLSKRYYLLNSLTVDDRPNKARLIHMSSCLRHKASNGSLKITDRLIKFVRGSSRVENSTLETAATEITSTDTSSRSVLSEEDSALIFVAESYFSPENIWESDTATGRLLRDVAYGKPDLARPVPNYDRLAPNIAHVIWTNDDPMPFLFYLCAVSLLEVANVDRLYIHGDGPPSGFYWNLIKDHPKIRLVYRTVIEKRFERIFGTKVRKLAHVTDIWRTDILYRYGGLYVDTDVIFFRPLDRDIRAYDAVLSKDVSKRGSFPNSYQNGVMLGKPGADFWRLHLESMRNYKDTDWLWNSCFQTYKIKERHPELVHVDPRLNTICSFSKCYPSWLENFREAANDHIATGSLENWLHDTYAIHHTVPNLEEFKSFKALVANNGSTIFGEVGLYVLRRTGEFEYLQKLAHQSTDTF